MSNYEINIKPSEVDPNGTKYSGRFNKHGDGTNRPDAIKGLEPNEDDIPKVFIDGVIPTTKDDVLAEMTYISKTEQFHAYLEIKCQGNTSMSFPKKNFTIKMYSDFERETKLKKAFKDWGHEQNKYVLKANWIDHSHSRNIVSARLWSEVVESRSDYNSLPTELKTSPNNGAIDGFPVKVYTNGTYQGIYTWNIGKDDWMWNMDEDNPNHVLMCAETNTNGVYTETPCNFRALWSGVNEQDWSVEVGTNSDAVKNSINALISCVKDTDDETFMATIGNYLDLQSAIDYYIHQYVICGLDGLGKNMLLGTYDLQKWYMGAYDMDATLGNYIMGGVGDIPATAPCPEYYQERFSLLFERVYSLYLPELVERYKFLRETVYSLSNMVTYFERFTDVIGKDLYAEDLTIYAEIPAGDTNNIQQIRNFIRDRLSYVDKKIIVENDDYLYVLPEPTVFNGTDTFIDTGVTLFDKPKDVTLVVNFTADSEQVGDTNYLLSNGEYNTLTLQNSGTKYWRVITKSGINPPEDEVNGSWVHTWVNTKTIVLVVEDGVFTFGGYKLNSQPNVKYIQAHENNTYHQEGGTLKIGCFKGIWSGETENFWKGTVNDFRVYNRALSEEEVNALILSY